MFRTSHVFRTRGMGTQQRTKANGGGPNLMVFLQLVPFLLILLLGYLPFSEPEYSLQRNYSYQFSRVTENYGVEFFVKSADFDVGSAARENIEEHVVQDYKNLLGRYCHIELQRQWSRNLPTPHELLSQFALDNCLTCLVIHYLSDKAGAICCSLMTFNCSLKLYCCF